MASMAIRPTTACCRRAPRMCSRDRGGVVTGGLREGVEHRGRRSVGIAVVAVERMDRRLVVGAYTERPSRATGVDATGQQRLLCSGAPTSSRGRVGVDAGGVRQGVEHGALTINSPGRGRSPRTVRASRSPGSRRTPLRRASAAIRRATCRWMRRGLRVLSAPGKPAGGSDGAA